MAILHNGCCLEYLKALPDNSIDLIFCDPPYALGSEVIIRPDGKPDYKKAVDFMNAWKQVDGEFWEQWFKEAFRVLKYGGRVLMFGMDRQLFLNCYYAVTAGFVQQQSLYWFFISNFPKSTDLSKNLDKHFKAEREVVGTATTDLAKKYDGYKYGIAPLKQTNETILVFQKPCKTGSPLHDVLAMESGDDSITASIVDIENNRVATSESTIRTQVNTSGNFSSHNNGFITGSNQGRFPAQTFVDSAAAEILGEDCHKILHKCDFDKAEHDLYFYCPKVSGSERNDGLHGRMDTKHKRTLGNGIGGVSQENSAHVENNHPTLKPVSLLVQILRLFKTPNDQVLLDPFMGSGSMAIAANKVGGFDYVGIELNPDYYAIAKERIAHCEHDLINMFG
jgi:site-specific DNA-methyltransferase (adenine-specific)